MLLMVSDLNNVALNYQFSLLILLNDKCMFRIYITAVHIHPVLFPVNNILERELCCVIFMCVFMHLTHWFYNRIDN